MRTPCGWGSTRSTSPTSTNCLASRSTRRSSSRSVPPGRSRKRAASSVPLPAGAGRTRHSTRSPRAASAAGGLPAPAAWSGEHRMVTTRQRRAAVSASTFADVVPTPGSRLPCTRRSTSPPAALARPLARPAAWVSNLRMSTELLAVDPRPLPRSRENDSGRRARAACGAGRTARNKRQAAPPTGVAGPGSSPRPKIPSTRRRTSSPSTG